MKAGIERERERETDTQTHRQRQRDRDRECMRECVRKHKSNQEKGNAVQMLLFILRFESRSKPTDQHRTPPSSSETLTAWFVLHRGKKPKKSAQEPNRKEGSTRLPKFPVVTLETKELATKQLYYSDVPMLRSVPCSGQGHARVEVSLFLCMLS